MKIDRSPSSLRPGDSRVSTQIARTRAHVQTHTHTGGGQTHGYIRITYIRRVQVRVKETRGGYVTIGACGEEWVDEPEQKVFSLFASSSLFSGRFYEARVTRAAKRSERRIAREREGGRENEREEARAPCTTRPTTRLYHLSVPLSFSFLLPHLSLLSLHAALVAIPRLSSCIRTRRLRRSIF